MIPQRVADLADALIAEFGHGLTRDEAIAKATRIISYMEREGWAIIEEPCS